MKQFTFFESYFLAAKTLKKREKAEFYEAILTYMFEGIEPEFNGALAGFWALIKPTLDKGKTRSSTKPKNILVSPEKNESPLEEEEKEEDKEEEGEGNDLPAKELKSYMDVLDLFKEYPKWFKGQAYEFEGVNIAISAYGKPYNRKNAKDIPRAQETRFLKYLLHNPQLLDPSMQPINNRVSDAINDAVKAI